MKIHTLRLHIILLIFAPFSLLSQSREESGFSLTTSLEYENDSNIFMNENEVDDTLWKAGLQADFINRSGLVLTESEFGVDVGRFSDFSNEDYENFSGWISLEYPYTRVDHVYYDFEAGYRETTTAVAAEGARLETDTGTVGILVSIPYSEKFALEGKTNFKNRNERTVGYSDATIWSYGAGFVYRKSEKLDWTGGVEIRNTDLEDENLEADDMYLHIGARGTFSEKVFGEVSVGYQTRDVDAAGYRDRDGAYFNTNLTWLATEKVSIVLSGTKDFDTTGSGLSTDTTALDLALDYELSDQIQLSFIAGLENGDYDSALGQREDDMWTYGIDATYYWSLRGSVWMEFQYWDRSSDVAYFDSDRSVFALGIDYTF